MKLSAKVHYAVCLLTAVCIGRINSAKALYDVMERHCGGTILLSDIPTKSLILLLTPEIKYSSLLDCHVTVSVESHMRIHLGFLEMDIQSFGRCLGDFLMILDSQPLAQDTFYFHDTTAPRYCGTNIPEPMTSTGNNLTLRFVSDAHVNGRGFRLLLTAFHENDCQPGEFLCSNRRCIDSGLVCDGRDNCGDDSDSCRLPLYILVGIAVVSILVVVAGLFLFVVLRYRCQQKQFDRHRLNYGSDRRLSDVSTVSNVPAWLSPVPSCASTVSTLTPSPTQATPIGQFTFGPQHLLELPRQNNEFPAF